MRLSRRLTIVFGALGLLTIAAIAGIAWWMSANEIRESVDDELRQRLAPVQLLAERIESAATVLPRAERLADDDFAVDDVFEENGPARIQIIESSGAVLGGTGIEPTDGALASLTTSEIHFETVTHDGTEYRVATVGTEETVPAGFPVGVQVVRDVTNENQAISDLAVRLALIGLLGVGAVTTAGWLIGRWLARPVLDLSARTRQLARLDDLPARVELHRDDEVGALAGNFNRVLSALEIGREQQQRLVADASHELRTPLAGVRVRLEYLARSVDDEQHGEILAGAIEDTEQLTALVQDLVDLAADVRSEEEPVQPADLVALVEEVAAQGRASTGREIQVRVDGESATGWPPVRPTMVRRAVRNLVDNAVKYAPDGPIEVVVSPHSITVHDGGPGVPDDERSHVFDRFYRSPKARSRPGNGIGLAIVQQVADTHGGVTWVSTSPLGGAAIGFSVEPSPA